MKKFKHYFFSILDTEDKKKFIRYFIVLFLGSVFSVFGIGAVIPLINVLIQPDKMMSYPLFQGWGYHQVIMLLTLALVVAFAIKNLVALCLLAYQARFLFGLVAKLQSKLFNGYMALPYEYHLNRSTPDLIKNVNNETTVLSNYVVAPLGTFLTEFLSSFFILIVLLAINPVFTLLVFFFLTAGIFLFMKAIKRRTEHYSNLRSNSWTSMTEAVLTGLSGVKESKLYHCESTFLKQFDQEAVKLRSSSAFQLTFQQAPRMLIEFVGLTVVMCVLCGFVLSGHSAQSMFVLLGVFGVAAAQLLPSLNRLTQSLVQIKYGMPALKSIYQELNQVREVDLALLKQKEEIKKPAFCSVISLINLHYCYGDGTHAINGVSLEILKNKKTAFVGVSGAGKTTLVDLIMGLYVPSKGSLRLDGKKIQSNEQRLSFQKLFGYIPQSIVLYNKTIRENIAFGVEPDKIDDQLVWQCLKAASLEGFVKKLKYKEKAFIGEGGVRLSGGQRQRVGIARALYQQPEILVMDEATSALDNKTEQEVTDVLSRLKNLTIITIAHRLTTIKDYDLIHLMEDGKVIDSGSYGDLLKTSDSFRRMALATEEQKVGEYA